MRPLDLLVPDGVGDPRRPSGGNRYDREVAAALCADGWDVRMIEVARADDGGSASETAERLRHDAVTIVDGLLLHDPASISAQLPSLAVPMLHMPPPDRRDVLDLLSRAPVLITSSSSTKRHVVELLAGRTTPPVMVAQPGVDRTRTVVVSPTGSRLRCIAALTPHKGQDVLLAALARVRDLDWQCELVGATDVNPRYTEALREQATRLGIAHRVVFAGPRKPDPVVRLYEDCDLLVLPSRNEGYGMVLAEAISCGIPVIASDVGGTREALGGTQGAQPGLLVRAGDAGDLARALRAWLSSHGLRLDLVGAARARSRHRRTWGSTARLVGDAIDRIPVPSPEPDRVTR